MGQIRFIQMAIPKLTQRLPDAPPSALWLMAFLFYLIALGLKVSTSRLSILHEYLSASGTG